MKLVAVLSFMAVSVLAHDAWAIRYFGRWFQPQSVFDRDMSHANSEDQTAYQKILAQVKFIDGAKAAIPVLDESYNVNLHGSNEYPYVPSSVYENIAASKACDLNTVGACVVIERDQIAGKTTNAAYYLGGALHKPKPTSGYGVVRVDVSASLQTEVDQLANHFFGQQQYGVYIISQALDGKAALELDKIAIDGHDVGDAKEAQPVTPPPAPKPDAPKPKIAMAISDEDKAYFASETATIDKMLGANAPTQSAAATPTVTSCWLKAKMRNVRNVYILDFLTSYTDANGIKQHHPARSSIANPVSRQGTQNNQLFCKLSDGSEQFPRIAINEYAVLRIGLAFSKTVQTLVASGIGSNIKNGALDILAIEDFGFLFEKQFDFIYLGATMTPGLLSRMHYPTGAAISAGPVLSAAVSGGLGWRSLNIVTTVGGWYDITIDPNDG